MGDEEEQTDEQRNQRCMVALYKFDPATIDWPFRRNRPLQLEVGQKIEVIEDDESGWVLGCYAGQDVKGFFPKNYTVTYAEYMQIMEDYEDQEFADEPAAAEDEFEPPYTGPPQPTAIPEDPLPSPRPYPLQEVEEPEDRMMESPELVYPGTTAYPVLKPSPPVETTYEVNKSRMLRSMPSIPKRAPAEPEKPSDDIEAARRELEREFAAKREEDVMAVAGGKLTESRQSTPATTAAVRPERDFVRKHLAIEDLQANKMKEVPTLVDLVAEREHTRGVPIRLQKKRIQPYQQDLRVRSVTCRIAENIEPAHMRNALNNSEKTGSRWTQMFRPGFNDLVNETFKCGANACILSKHYLNDRASKEQFQRLHIQSVNGTLNFELQRSKDHCFYMRMDYVDVMMSHPDAWCFPDVSRTVSANPGEPVNPFHGWFAQSAIDADKEMEDVDFSYTLRLRMFPEATFQALALGKVPDWIQPYLSLRGEAEKDMINEEDDEEGADGDGGEAIKMDDNLMLEAGLEDQDDMYVRLDELRFAKERTAGPDVLDTKATRYTLKGLSAMRIFLRSKGQPDNMKQAPISPKQVKDMAAQLGIRNDPAHYWYCLFALKYPLAPEWEVVVRSDTRFYLHLPSDRMQPVHPMVRSFQRHLEDCMQNEFLWDFRGFVTMKCADCGVPDSVVWCQQCTDFFCAPCFLRVHKSKRGQKHCPMPIPGCRYLKESEATRLQSQIPLLNIGFSNRRRFLARDNQSDKMGSRSGDTWLFFSADTFQAALAQAPDSRHLYLKRLVPPRLAPDAPGYYYNFGYDVIADDDSHIISKTHEQKALSLLQRWFRGCLARKRIRMEVKAALIIQKSKKMWDCQKQYGAHGRNAAILKGWYRKWKAREDRRKLEHSITRVQARWRSCMHQMEYAAKRRSARKIQALYRGRLSRKRSAIFLAATKTIQRTYRGHLYGRRPVAEMIGSALKIQAMFRGIAHREHERHTAKAVLCIQTHCRGLAARLRVKRMLDSANMIQRNWRRFQALLDVKMIVYERLERYRQKRQELLRAKLEGAVASIIQRNWRRHRDYQTFVLMRREKGEADRRISTMLVALFTASAGIRHHVHPWWRHLPTEIQEVLGQIKASLQRTIGLVPVKGKMANEELGRKGLRVASSEHLHYTQDTREPDPASHMLMSITRHLLSHVPAELFGPTVKWACYAIGHQAVEFHGTISKKGEMKPYGIFPKQEIIVGKEMPPHPGDNLSTLWRDTGTLRHHHDFLVNTAEESLPALMLNRLPSHHRHVYLTAQVLITMRQALDSPTIATEDHLKFQGLDAVAGAQLMEVLGAETDQSLPLEWPKTHGTVAALAAQWSTHMSELKAEKAGDGDKKAPKKASAKTKAAQTKTEASKDKIKTEGSTISAATAKSKAKSKSGAKDSKSNKAATDKESSVGGGGGGGGGPGGGLTSPTAVKSREPPEGGILSVFTRAASLRILQQVGFLMRDQDHLLEAVLGRSENTGGRRGQGVRQSRFISVTDKLFEMADRAKHDHCSFVLAVVLYHMVLRALHTRVLYHRAAMAMQKRLRYERTKGKKANSVKPATTIQKFWRGLSASMKIMRMDDAAFTIQNNYRAFRWNRRANKLLKSTLLAQRIWMGAIHRAWLRECHGAATCIQKHFRRFHIRVVYDKKGKALLRQFQEEMNEVLRKKSRMPAELFQQRTEAIAHKARIEFDKHRKKNVENVRMRTRSLKARAAKRQDKLKKLSLVGAIQPQRESVFEPMVFAMKRLYNQAEARYGANRSRVLNQCAAEKKRLIRILPQEPAFSVHAASKRARAALFARRLAKRPKEARVEQGGGPIDESMFLAWQHKQFAT